MDGQKNTNRVDTTTNRALGGGVPLKQKLRKVIKKKKKD